MNKTILIFGLIAGLIVSSILFISSGLGVQNMDYGMILGYTSMLIAFSAIFFGIRAIRDKQLNGEISFGKAFKVGLLITIIASTLYVISWMIIVNTYGSGFMEEYYTQSVAKMEASGMATADIEKRKAEMIKIQEMYKSPFVKVGLTYMEILPIGILVSLITALILRRKPEKSTALS